eukprot:SAG31_NODE_1229_length_9222_cov_5.317549_4_plen_202_part_00
MVFVAGWFSSSSSRQQQQTQRWWLLVLAAGWFSLVVLLLCKLLSCCVEMAAKTAWFMTGGIPGPCFDIRSTQSRSMGSHTGVHECLRAGARPCASGSECRIIAACSRSLWTISTSMRMGPLAPRAGRRLITQCIRAAGMRRQAPPWYIRTSTKFNMTTFLFLPAGRCSSSTRRSTSLPRYGRHAYGTEFSIVHLAGTAQIY